MIQANKYIRPLYCLSLIALLLPSLQSGWVSLTVGFHPLQLGIWFHLALLLFVIYRIYNVIRLPQIFSFIPPKRSLKIANQIGLGLMLLGLLITIAKYLGLISLLFISKYAQASSLYFYIGGFYFALLADILPAGIMVFELSRLLGFELHHCTSPAISNGTT